MIGYLLDTNVISELRKKRRCNAGVRSWMSEVDSEGLFLSVLVIGEIRQGIETIRRRDSRSARYLDQWLARIQTGYQDRILPVTREITEVWGRMNAVRPHPVVDSLLAATAKVHELTLVTHNIGDIEDTGVEFYDPFS